MLLRKASLAKMRALTSLECSTSSVCSRVDGYCAKFFERSFNRFGIVYVVVVVALFSFFFDESSSHSSSVVVLCSVCCKSVVVGWK